MSFKMLLPYLAVFANFIFLLVGLMNLSSIIFKFKCFCTKYIKDWILFLNLIIVFTATIGSLYYSEILQFAPCKLCWYQRIFMYPQVFLYWLAIILKDKNIIKYTFVLSILGAPIAFYHYALQRGWATGASCSAVGYSLDCSQQFIMNFNYITIPFMAFSAFMLTALFSAIYLFKKQPK